MKENASVCQPHIKTPCCRRRLSGLSVVLALAFLSLNTQAALLTWDGLPTNAGADDGNAGWGVVASNTNWWNGAANVVWNNANGDTAVLGVNSATNVTVTLSNSVMAGGLTYSNAGTGVYTIGVASSASLSLVGNSPTIRLSGPGTGVHVINPSVSSTGLLSIVSTFPTAVSINCRLANVSNNIPGGLAIGTPGNASYATPTGLYVDFNNATIANTVNNLTNVTVYSNATFRISGQNATAFNLNFPKQLTISGDGENGTASAWVITGNAGGTYNANVVLAGSSTIDMNAGTAGQTYTLNGPISGTGDLLLVSANTATSQETLALTNACSFAGNLTVAGRATLRLIGGNNRLPTGTVLTLGSSSGANAFWVGNGKLTLGNAPLAVSQTLAGLITGNTGCAVSGGNTTNVSTLIVNNSIDNIYAGSLGGASAPSGMLALVKQGAGTLFLQGTNQCTGGYTVSAGILEFGDGATDYPLTGPLTNNSSVVFDTASTQTFPGAVSGSGSVSQVGFGILTLSGTNSYSGPTTVNSGTVNLIDSKSGTGPITVAAGAGLGITRSTVTGSVSASSASLDTATLNLNFNLVSPNSTAPLNVIGTFVNNGSTTINLQSLGSLSLGSFPLIKYGSYQSNDFSSLALGALQNGVTATLQNNPGNSSIDLVITALNALKWTGATDNNWDFTTINWFNAATLSATAYADGQFVTFDDSAIGPTAIAASSSPQPGSMTVSNNSKAYSFTGAGIGGSATLLKQGTGTLTIAAVNNNVGGTSIQRGTLQVGDGTTDGTITSPIANNAALVLNILNSATYSGISGTGTVTKAGSGQLNLGANSYSGQTAVQAGKLYLQDSAALGGTTNNAAVQVGTELWLDAGGITIPESLTIGGTGVDGTVGAFNASDNAAAAAWSGPIALTTNIVFTTPYDASVTLSGPLTAGNNSMVFRADGLGTFAGYYLVSGNINGKSVALTGQGGLLLAGTNNSLTNVMVLTNVPAGSTPSLNAGLWVRNSLGLGTNCTVTLTNGGHIGDTGTQLGLDNNVTVPTGVTLNAYCPGEGAEGPGGYRCTLAVRTSTTNTWNGPINIMGADPNLSAVPLFIMYGGGATTSGRLIINGDVSGTNGVATLLVRGFGSGLLTGHINLGTNLFAVTDGATWTVASSGNIWSITQCGGGGETLALGADNALCTAAPVWMRLNTPGNNLDLNGYNQQIGGLFNDGTGQASIRNSSTNADSTLKLVSSLGTNWVYGGTLTIVPGANALHLDVAGDTLTLTAAGNNYGGNTTVRNGAALALSGSGNISASAVIDVQAGGTFDVSARTSGSYVVPLNTTLKGNGSVVGNLELQGHLAPGASVGTLTVSGDVTDDASSVTLMEVDNTTHANDQLSVGGSLAYNGTLLVTNISGVPYTNNQVLTLFNATGGYTGSFANILFPGVTAFDASGLTVNGTITVTSVLPNTPTTINYTVIGGGTQLQLSWPASYTGWLLQAQTNGPGIGLSTNWQTVPGSAGVNQITVPIVKDNPSVFYRLAHP
jgi:autotransporter-associated beta strand protein